jgi:hypothetical protein
MAIHIFPNFNFFSENARFALKEEESATLGNNRNYKGQLLPGTVSQPKTEGRRETTKGGQRTTA